MKHPRAASRPYTTELLPAGEAARRLGVSKSTLYAYVSRGMLSALADPDDPRASRYSSFEVEQLMRRRGQGRRAEQQIPGTMTQGLQVLDTALTGIIEGQPVYRGRAATTLAAEGATLEDVARLLWQFGPSDPFAGPAPELGPPWLDGVHHTAAWPLSDRVLARWGAALGGLHGPAWLPDGETLARACGQHLRAALACFVGVAPSALPAHELLARHWALPEGAADLVRQAMVLTADHEMNLIGLSSRQLASVGATLGSALMAALCYVSAAFNGGDCARVEALWDEVTAQPDEAAALSARLDRGETLPGFDHLYYPAGDPRAMALLALVERWGAAAPMVATVDRLTGWKPSLDFGLVALRRAIGAPREAATVLLMAPRCVGFLAHALEQRRSGERMWVRSRYVGP
ncbi:citrate synthase [Ideonella sp. DXS29W]|uniref:citrate synthase (unknown stereospecificity) n=1 Tax=Ideonella lacteola TaxID=2984193 RepID=A0ABU9BT09_9BURK